MQKGPTVELATGALVTDVSGLPGRLDAHTRQKILQARYARVRV